MKSAVGRLAVPWAAPLLMTALAQACHLAAADHASQRPNVLMIAIDDLNHWVGHLERNRQTRTPHIDRLAGRGVTFRRAYCAAPLCNPSRAALLSGWRPSTTGIYLNAHDWRQAIPEEQTLTTQFLKAGYEVYGAGKIYHGGVHRAGEWTEYFEDRSPAELVRHASASDEGVGAIKFYPLQNEDHEMPDYRVVEYGIQKLRGAHRRPFFLAVGLVKPHMPFAVPQKYFDMFPLETIELPPYREDDLDDVPPAGVAMAAPDADHAQIVASGRWKEAIRGYLAAIAFCDAMVGRLLDALESSEYAGKTIVVLWGDHGWHLGEKHHWRKFALWEEGTRAPLIWVVPGLTRPGGVCDRPVDFMSIYHTLCELAGLPVPGHVEGASLRPLLANPAAEWPRAALSTMNHNNHAVRNERYRYIRYANGEEELYDHQADPHEWTNVVHDPRHAAALKTLRQSLPELNAPPRERDGARAE